LSEHHIGAVFAWFRRSAVPAPAPPTWPLAGPFDSTNNPVQVAVADFNYEMLRLVDEPPVTLEQYLSASYRSGTAFTNPPHRDFRVNKYLFGSRLTSYADVAVVDTLMRLSGNSRDRIAVRGSGDQYQLHVPIVAMFRRTTERLKRTLYASNAAAPPTPTTSLPGTFLRQDLPCMPVVE
jgi:hypothetical protein